MWKNPTVVQRHVDLAGEKSPSAGWSSTALENSIPE